jgi:hypothetical protein
MGSNGSNITGAAGSREEAEVTGNREITANREKTPAWGNFWIYGCWALFIQKSATIFQNYYE